MRVSQLQAQRTVGTNRSTQTGRSGRRKTKRHEGNLCYGGRGERWAVGGREDFAAALMCRSALPPHTSVIRPSPALVTWFPYKNDCGRAAAAATVVA